MDGVYVGVPTARPSCRRKDVPRARMQRHPFGGIEVSLGSLGSLVAPGYPRERDSCRLDGALDIPVAVGK